MNTYKIGNKAKCIIRSYAPGKIGEDEMVYANQPYTILKDVEFKISVESKASSAEKSSNYNLFLDYYENKVKEIEISNIKLTDKILNLLYSKNEEKLCHVSENHQSDNEKKIYINTDTKNIYQVFIYNSSGELENAYGTLDVTDGYILVENDLSNYLICYSFLGNKSVLLNSSNNYYLTLDFETYGNEDDDTVKMWIHIDKCVLETETDLIFNNELNTVDCKFKVINDKTTKNYITFR